MNLLIQVYKLKAINPSLMNLQIRVYKPIFDGAYDLNA